MQDPARAIPRPPEPEVYENLRAISWLLLSVAASSAMTIAVRVMSFEIHPSMIVFLRFSFTSVLLFALVLVFQRYREQMTFTQPGSHLIRGLFMAISTHLGFYAIANMELVTVTVLFFMVPIFATALSGVINHERPGPRRIIAIAVSFLGVILILKPGYQPLNQAVFAALASSVLFAGALVMSRKLASKDGTFATLISSTTITFLFSIPLVIPVWELPGSASMWGIVAFLVITGLIRLVGDLQAYRLGEASVLAPITYLRLILIGAAAYVMFNEVPDGLALIGTAIIIASALYIARREARLKRAAQS